jgi:hypothetical protein
MKPYGALWNPKKGVGIKKRKKNKKRGKRLGFACERQSCKGPDELKGQSFKNSLGNQQSGPGKVSKGFWLAWA